ncbi:uncharacterized protein LAJ45_10982 [Morchella importuna]|uniref:uncharacterized protein n=1 Tax=Morchella importuna TaxID=1174673 RepID=UPI001E8D5580|nr:uncharacterized protein LAJ45_10982 [Morchella importuna]KAH8144962.1 hypothetical protein LAJ45_10982 [Morchella importuna]
MDQVPDESWRSLIPTGIDLFTASVYPATLLLGSVYSTLSPDTASTDSYFSRKSNFANIFFVKYGWLWTTLVFALHLTRLRSPSRPQALLRYALATLWWVAVTQWFFGAPIMDRTFTLTGGACRAVMRDPGAVKEVLGEKVLAATSAACKLAGGRWRGGHDLSGHTFLLTHARGGGRGCGGVVGRVVVDVVDDGGVLSYVEGEVDGVDRVDGAVVHRVCLGAQDSAAD